MTKDTQDWTEWAPHWSKKNKTSPTSPKTPHDFQEQNAPTTIVRQKLSTERTTTKHRQRIVDARLWKAMSPFQQNAALALEHAFHVMSIGLGYRTSSPHKLNTGKAHYRENDRDGEVIALYFQWAERCQKGKLHHAAAIDVLAYGHSCVQVDRNRRVRNGWAKKNLLLCLDVYCNILGWPIQTDK